MPCCLQACSLLMEMKKEYGMSHRLFEEVLRLFAILAPRNCKIPNSWYLMKRTMREPLEEEMDRDTFFVRDMCSDPACDYLYKSEDGDRCPVPGCGAPRYRFVSEYL